MREACALEIAHVPITSPSHILFTEEICWPPPVLCCLVVVCVLWYTTTADLVNLSHMMGTTVWENQSGLTNNFVVAPRGKKKDPPLIRFFLLRIWTQTHGKNFPICSQRWSKMQQEKGHREQLFRLSNRYQERTPRKEQWLPPYQVLKPISQVLTSRCVLRQ